MACFTYFEKSTYLFWLFVALIFHIRICTMDSISNEEEDELMDMLLKEVAKSVEADDRSAFVELCITKREMCNDGHFTGNDAIFNWQLAATKRDRERFWRTYQCVYRQKSSECPVDGGWSEWSLWSNCDATCEETGHQVRTRTCENPKPSGGGDPCDGISKRNRSCIGLCIQGSNGREEANQYIKQVHEIYPVLKQLCIEQHCLYDQVRAHIKDTRRVDKYWSSIVCVKFGGACPVNGGWSEWGQWSDCSVKCGYGEKFRKRECDKPTTQNGGIFCQGEWHMKMQCLSKGCEGDVSFSDWSDFSPCSERCGKYGTKTSVRSCLAETPCMLEGRAVSEITITAPCFGGYCPNDGGWSKWGTWSDCSAKCGGGRRTRLRWCDSPFPYGGKSCPGPAISVASCAGSFCIQPAPDNYDDDNDEKRRRRRAGGLRSTEKHYMDYNDVPNYLVSQFISFFSDILDKIKNTIEFLLVASADICYSHSENVVKALPAINANIVVESDLIRPSYNMTRFHGESGKKIKSSLHRKLKRLRRDTAVTSRSAAIQHSENAAEVDISDPYSAPLNADLETLYTPWTQWTECSATCGVGTRKRRRQCTDKLTACRGEVEPIQFCNIKPCPVAGAWSVWGTWTACTVTCGTGISERFRKCDNPLPTYGGACVGRNFGSQPCVMPPCPPTPTKSWSSWGEWSDCSTSCGFGAKSRSRFRELMSEVQSEEVVCNGFPCPENGLWAAWGAWSSCTLPCGLGQMYRDRTCTDPAPVYHGLPCEGQGSDVQTCFAGPCSDDDDFGILLRGNGFIKYDLSGRTTGMMMVFIRFRTFRPGGILFHHTASCKSQEKCKTSIKLRLASNILTLTSKVQNRDKLEIKAAMAIQVNDWNDVLAIVTTKWAELKLNDQATVEEWFTGKLDKVVNLDGVLMVGSDKRGSEGFHGEMAVLRKNFKAFALLPVKGWSGKGAPSKSRNVGKISLSTNVRHPNFQGRYYSHLFYRKSNFIHVSAVVQVTSSNGLLFFNGGYNSASFVSVALESGAINFCLSCADKSECRKAYEIKTNKWFLLRFVVKNKEGVIRMNNGDAMQIMCADDTKFMPRSSLYVGGAKDADWDTIVDLTKDSAMIRGLIDTLHLNGESISFKMATLLSTAGVVNSIGYSLADHVTEVYGHRKSLTTLRCAFPESARAVHFTRLIWVKNMVLLKSNEHAEIVETESTDKSVSILNLYPTQPSDGVYACLESSDGELSVLHVFLVLLQGDKVEDPEGESEWILFIILVVFIILILLAILAYCYYEKLRQWLTKCLGGKEEELEKMADDTTDDDEADEGDTDKDTQMETVQPIEEETDEEVTEVLQSQNFEEPESEEGEEVCLDSRKKAFHRAIRNSLDNLRQTLSDRRNRECIFIARPSSYGYRRLSPIQACPMSSAQQQATMQPPSIQPCSRNSDQQFDRPFSLHPSPMSHPGQMSSSHQAAWHISPLRPCSMNLGKTPPRQMLPINPFATSLGQQPAISPIHPYSMNLGQQPSAGYISPINFGPSSSGQQSAKQISPIYPCSTSLGHQSPRQISPINPCSTSSGQQTFRQISPIYPCSMRSGQQFMFGRLGPNLYPKFPLHASSGGGECKTNTLSPSPCRWPTSIPPINCKDKWTKPLPVLFEDCLSQDYPNLPTTPKIPSLDLMRFSPIMNNTLRISPVDQHGNLMSSTPLFGYINPVNIMHTDTLRGYQEPQMHAAGSIPLPSPPASLIKPKGTTDSPKVNMSLSPKITRKPPRGYTQARRVSFNTDSTKEK